MVLSFSRDFTASGALASKNASLMVASSGSAEARVNVGSECPTDRWTPPGFGDNSVADRYDTAPIWTNRTSGEPFAVYHRSRHVQAVYAADAIGATNRYIGQNDNAAFFAGLIRPLAKPGAKVVFVEAAIGNVVEPSLLDLVGGWAVAAWWQLILFAVIVIYTLGKRFGIPDAIPYRQRGARELVDAVGDVYKRSGATNAALDAVYKDCDRRVRQALKLGRDASKASRDLALPDELAKAFFLVETACQTRPPEGAALNLAQKLERLTDTFVGGNRKPIRRRRR